MGQGGVRVRGGGSREDPVFEKQVYTQFTPSPPIIILHTRSKWQRASLWSSAHSAAPLVQPHTLHLLARYVGDGLGCCWLLPVANIAVKIYNL